jgi:hypothetical protein
MLPMDAFFITPRVVHSCIHHHHQESIVMSLETLSSAALVKAHLSGTFHAVA